MVTIFLKKAGSKTNLPMNHRKIIILESEVESTQTKAKSEGWEVTEIKKGSW